MAVAVKFNQAALEQLVRSEPVQRHLLRVGNRVRDRARELVGVSAQPRGGHLRDAILTRIRPDGVAVGVFTEPEATRAVYHHEGTRPHVIRPRKAKVLAFNWAKAGRVVFFRKVKHPGTRPNRFLLNALKDVIPRRSWR